MRYVLTTKQEWAVLKEKVRIKYQNLTPRDLEFEEGKYTEMLDGLCIKLGKTRQEFTRILNSL